MFPWLMFMLLFLPSCTGALKCETERKGKTHKTKEKYPQQLRHVHATIIIYTSVALVQWTLQRVVLIWANVVRGLFVPGCVGLAGLEPTSCALLGRPWCLSLSSVMLVDPRLLMAVCVFRKYRVVVRAFPAWLLTRGSIEGQPALLFRLSLCPCSTAVKYIQYNIIYIYMHIYFLWMHIFSTIFALTHMDRYFFLHKRCYYIKGLLLHLFAWLQKDEKEKPICRLCSSPSALWPAIEAL